MPKDHEPSSGAIVINGGLLTNRKQLARFQRRTAKQLALIQRNEKDNVTRRLFAGLALHIIKESLAHGEWLPWLEKHVTTETSMRQVHYMMAAALVWVEAKGVAKPAVASLPGGNFSLTVRDCIGRKLVTSAAEFVGERTWGELLADHEIRDGGGSLGGARKHPTAKAPKQSPEQLYLFARDEIGGWLESGERVFQKENLLQHMTEHPEEVAGVVESLRKLADEVEKAAKPLLKK